MEYSNQELKIIYEIKRSIINEFRYLYKKSSDFDHLAHIMVHDDFIDVKDLKFAFRIGMSSEEKKILRKFKFLDLFNQALAELFAEGLIEFIDTKKVAMTEKGDDMYIIPDKWYKKID